MKLSPIIAAALSFSLPATAGPEVGAVVGYSLMSPSTGASADGGFMMGARGGFRTDSGAILDAQVLRNSSGSGGLSTSETVMGVGLRYLMVDAGLSPFVSGHVNYHMGAQLSGGGVSQAIPDSSGIGIDAGGGLQIRISDLIYTDVLAHYALQFTGQHRHNTLGLGLGFGATF